MSGSFHYDSVHAFRAVVVGEPGQRVFFLQFHTGIEVVNLRLEKQQVAALGDHLRQMLVDLPQPDAITPSDAVSPGEVAWVVGALGAAYDANEDRVLVVAEEFVETDDDDEPILDEDGQGMLTVRLTRAQALAFVTQAADLVAAGRPSCQWCGRPMDPAGHACARMN
jgi:uncharacterized repeat protein (TIGR03847 family)